MKRKASTELLRPRCEFKDEDGTQSNFESLEEHESIPIVEHDKLYGVEVEYEETPTNVRELLDKLQAQLDSFPGKTDILLKLKACSPSPLEDDAMMLRFVRAELYDPRRAARRILNHYDKKLELFGSDKLGTAIAVEDLDHDDLQVLRSGGFQPLPSKDRGGRIVIYERFQCITYKSPLNLLRAVWFAAMSMVEGADPKGRLVLISFQTGPYNPDLFERATYKQSINIISKLLPLRLAGYHFCFDDIRYRMVWGLATIYLGKEAQQIAIDHEGTAYECRYGLMSYGINVDDLPITVDGVDESNSDFGPWIEKLQANEN